MDFSSSPRQSRWKHKIRPKFKGAGNFIAINTTGASCTTEAPVTCPCFLLRFRLCFQDPAKNHNIVNSLFKAAVCVGGIGTHTSMQLALNSETLTLWSLWRGCSAENLKLSELRTTRPCCAAALPQHLRRWTCRASHQETLQLLTLRRIGPDTHTGTPTKTADARSHQRNACHCYHSFGREIPILLLPVAISQRPSRSCSKLPHCTFLTTWSLPTHLEPCQNLLPGRLTEVAAFQCHKRFSTFHTIAHRALDTCAWKDIGLSNMSYSLRK